MCNKYVALVASDACRCLLTPAAACASTVLIHPFNRQILGGGVGVGGWAVLLSLELGDHCSGF